MFVYIYCKLVSKMILTQRPAIINPMLQYINNNNAVKSRLTLCYCDFTPFTHHLNTEIQI